MEGVGNVYGVDIDTLRIVSLPTGAAYDRGRDPWLDQTIDRIEATLRERVP